MLEDEVAQAIRDAFPHQRVGSRPIPSWAELLECDKETWRRMARAAISSLGGFRVYTSVEGE
jgi:hypothetical protein